MHFYILKKAQNISQRKKVLFSLSVPGYKGEDKGIKMWHDRPAQSITSLDQLGTDKIDPGFLKYSFCR